MASMPWAWSLRSTWGVSVKSRPRSSSIIWTDWWPSWCVTRTWRFAELAHQPSPLGMYEAVFIGAIADSVGVQDEYVTVTNSAASRRRRLTETLTVAYTIETPTLEMAEEAAAELGAMSASEIDAAFQAEAADQGVSSDFASIQTTAASTPTASTEGETLDGASAASAFGVVLSAAVGLAALA